RTGQPARAAAAALKTSYYTGSGDVNLMPARLRIAVRPGLLSDEELRELVIGELRLIIRQKRELKDALAATYPEAEPAARQIIERLTAEQDPELFKWVRANAGVR